MSRLKNVKLALLISLGFSQAAFAFSPVPKFTCGTYHVQGILNLNSRGSFVLTVQANTASPYELILLGGIAENKMNFVGQPVAVEIYAFHELKSNNDPSVFFRGWVTMPKNPNEPVMKIADEPCGKAEKYIKPAL